LTASNKQPPAEDARAAALAAYLESRSTSVTFVSLRGPDGRSQHAWLRSRPATVSDRTMRRELQKRAFLIEHVGADRFGLSRLPPNRRAWLAQTGRQSTNQALTRLAPERRYPVLMCFCAESLERVTDDSLEVFDLALGASDRAAQRALEELERRASRDTRFTVKRSSISPRSCSKHTTRGPICCA
jgi:hypothetical protein